MKNKASNIIISHNHPSGNPTPSDNDLFATEKLLEISKITGITIIDHVIIADEKHYSIRENNIDIKFNDVLKNSSNKIGLEMKKVFNKL